MQTVFHPKVIWKWERISKGAIGILLNSTIWLVVGTSLGEPISFQAFEDIILTESPSSTIVQSMILAVTHTYFLKGTVDWRQDVFILIQSKEMTSLLREGSI